MPASVEYEPAENLRPIVRKLIQENLSTFGHITIDNFIFLRRISESSAKWIAKTSLVPKKFQGLLKADFVIEIDETNFGFLSPEKQEVILFKELCSTHLTENGNFKIVKPDVQEYLRVVEKYGIEVPEIARLLKVASKRIGQIDLDEAEDEEEAM